MGARDLTSLVVQWLGLRTSTTGGVDSIPGWGTKILHAQWHAWQKKKKKKERKKSQKHYLHGPENAKLAW